jgi:hypothetical protein
MNIQNHHGLGSTLQTVKCCRGVELVNNTLWHTLHGKALPSPYPSALLIIN